MENDIEVVAYNARNLMSSLPAVASLSFQPETPQPRPNLHVLSIGVNEYQDSKFQSLKLAVADAEAVGKALARAGDEAFGDVRISYAFDGNATIMALEETIIEIGKEIHPRDVFILFAAAHGTSDNGTFYLIPQDFRSDDERPLRERAVSQARLQNWFSNHIKARRAIVLLDTCESGALVSGPSTSDTSIGRLHEAIGRPVLTATAIDQVAVEGYKGHGVFTYAILDALRNGDANGNGLIEVSELANHVQQLSPILSSELLPPGTRGAFEARDVVVPRSSGFKQKPRLGSTAEDFSLVPRLN